MSLNAQSWLHVIELEGMEAKLSIVPGSAQSLVPGLTVIAQEQTKELLLELDRKALSEPVLLDGEKVFAVKPWRPHQILSVGSHRFICLPNLGAHLFQERSEQQKARQLDAMYATSIPEVLASEVNTRSIFSRKQSVLLGLALSLCSIAAYGLLTKAPATQPVREQNLVQSEEAKKEVVAQMPQAQKVAEVAAVVVPKVIEPQTAVLAVAVAKANSPAAPKKEVAKTVVQTSSSSVRKTTLRAQEISDIRNLLQRASLEARFDPERARGKMQDLLVRAKSDANLTQVIRQEINLIP